MRVKTILNQSGDTIVEVLLALAVVSAVLGGAYASANRSVSITRASQERGESLKVVEDQVEKLKVAIEKGKSMPGGTFCIDDSLNPISPPTPAACNKQPINGVEYRLSVQPSVGTDTYTVTSQWDSLRGGTDEIKMIYRVYP